MAIKTDKIPRRPGRPRTPAFEIPLFDGMEQMAGATGIPLDILKAAKKAGCMFHKHSRWDLVAFLRWFFNRDIDGEDNVDWTKRDKRASALIREVKLEEARGELVNFNETSQFIRHLIGVGVFGELERISSEFPALLKGKNEVTIHEECLKQTAKIKQSLNGQIDRYKKEKGKTE